MWLRRLCLGHGLAYKGTKISNLKSQEMPDGTFLQDPGDVDVLIGAAPCSVYRIIQPKAPCSDIRYPSVGMNPVFVPLLPLISFPDLALSSGIYLHRSKYFWLS